MGAWAAGNATSWLAIHVVLPPTVNKTGNAHMT